MLIATFSNVHAQLQFGMELGANSIFGTRIHTEDFNLSHKWDQSFMNIGLFASMQKGQNHYSIGYRGSYLNGTYKMTQAGIPNLLVDIYYEYFVNRYYFSYHRSWKNFRVGGNLSGFQIENSGFGMGTSLRGVGTSESSITSDFNAPKRWYLVPALELGYDIKIKKVKRLTAILEIPLRSFTGYEIFYESTVNNGQPKGIHFTPGLNGVFLNLRIPIFSVGKKWNYFAENQSGSKQEFNSSEYPK